MTTVRRVNTSPRRPRHSVVVMLGILVALASASVLAPGAFASAQVLRPQLEPVGSMARAPLGVHAAGALAGARRLDFGIALRPHDPAGLAAYAHAVSVSSSATFHRYLTPAEFAARFGATTATIRALTLTLRAAGLHVGRPSRNDLLVPVSGAVSKIESALHTSLRAYRLRDGELGWAASSAPVLPAVLAGRVQAVLGLNNLVAPQALLARRDIEASAIGTRATGSKSAAVGANGGAPAACADASDAARSGDGWTWDEIAQAYGLSGLLDAGSLGAGETIALFELESYLPSDIAAFDRCYFGVDHSAQVSAVPIDGFDLHGAGSSGESTLDIETLSALAPSARILVYEAPNTNFGALDEYNAIVSQDSATLISSSWGECETAVQIASPGVQQVENELFEEAAAQGQTVFAAAGDTGSDDCAGTQFSTTKAEPPYLSVEDPASQPYVVAVGGTSLRADAPPLGGARETTWNDGPDSGGGGGGISTSWPAPTWQVDSGVPGVETSGGREVPDVSADADELHGITVYGAAFGAPAPGAAPPSSGASVPTGWTTIGGTSISTPIWAAIAADIATSSSCTGLALLPGGRDLGFLAPELYAVAASHYAQSFNDVTEGTNDVFGLSLGYSSTPGYDLASGLGSPIVTNGNGTPALAGYLCAAASGTLADAPPRPTITALSPASGPTSGGATVTISGVFDVGPATTATVYFGAAVATVLSASTSAITVTVPAAVIAPSTADFAGAGPAPVSVSISDASDVATSDPSSVAIYDYVLENAGSQTVPTVTGLGPPAGNVTGDNTVAIFGSGFDASTPTVTFGGVAAISVRVLSDFKLSVVVPPLSRATTCATGTGFAPTSDCQVEVVVTNVNGTSPQSVLLPALSGPIVFDGVGDIDPTPGTEVAPASTEYDYAPTPRITSITPGVSSTSPVVIKGSGFNLNTFYWVNFGPPSADASEQTAISYLSANTIEIAPANNERANSTASTALVGGVSVQSAAGLSNVVPFLAVRRPIVHRLSVLGGPTTGGQRLRITGAALGAVRSVEFVGSGGSQAQTVVSEAIGAVSSTSVTIVTPIDLAGPVDVLPCALSGCALAIAAVDTYVFYDPTASQLSLVRPASGPAHGGTVVTLFGNDLVGATAARFGTHAPVTIAVAPGYPANDPFVRSVVSAPGIANTTVPVAVIGRAASPVSPVDFTYVPSAPSAPLTVQLRRSGTTATLRWTAPASNGGTPIAGYTAVAVANGAPTVIERLGARVHAARFTGLVVGVHYTFRVAARSATFGTGLAATVV